MIAWWRCKISTSIHIYQKSTSNSICNVKFGNSKPSNSLNSLTTWYVRVRKPSHASTFHARGVDHLCHQLSIGYHLPTIAILGWWLRYYRNSSARSFMEQIIQNGWLILSEFKLDFKPTARSFPQRNRLIAGLSDALFLPEAREWSWSLITADFAYQQHKPIFVVPNPIFSENWIWSNHLVSSWKANLLSDFSPILKLFGIQQASETAEIQISTSISNLTDEEKSLLKIVSQHRDEDFSQRLSEISADFGEAMWKLTDLEMQWYVMQDVPGIYSVSVKI